MTKKEITIQGKTYPVVFNMKAMMNFEEIANKSFLGVTFDKLTDRIALIAAAVYAADPDTKLTVEDIMGDQSWEAVKDIIAAFTVVMTLTGEFFPIPAIEQELEPKPTAEDAGESEEGEDKPKN